MKAGWSSVRSNDSNTTVIFANWYEGALDSGGGKEKDRRFKIFF